ncbi:hypothetical protein J6590_050970 [Homalodisca vitripennis]|nr:hypothetical protein J6590_050970 [Homalodisca vitripennis]
MSMISMASGGILMYGVGPFVSYEFIHYVLLGICILFFILFPLLPNSPHALVMNNQVNSARKALTWLREKRSASCVEKELQAIQKIVTENQAESAGSIKELVTSQGNRRALTICCTLVSLQQLCGVTVVLFYMQQIFHSTGSNISSSTCSMIIGVVKLSAGFVCPVAVKSFGYKKPLIVSAFGSALGLHIIPPHNFYNNSLGSSLLPPKGTVIHWKKKKYTYTCVNSRGSGFILREITCTVFEEEPLVERGRRGPRPGQRGVQDHQKSCVGLVDGERWTTRGMIHSERQRVSSTPPAERIIEPRLLILKGLEKELRVGDVISGQ